MSNNQAASASEEPGNFPANDALERPTFFQMLQAGPQIVTLTSGETKNELCPDWLGK